MKKGIHPKFKKVKATCVCGQSFEVFSVLDEIKVDICSNCHPLYTGQLKLVDTMGRIDAFKKRINKKQTEFAYE